MIEDGVVTYGAPQSLLHAWGPTGTVLRAVLLASLTTLLSYQATATIIDLAFGMKKYGYARIRDLQLLLLTRRSSPIAVTKSLFRRVPFCTTHYVEQDDGRDTYSHDTHKLRIGVVIKLICVLLIAPVVNIGAIFLTLEYETTFTYAEARFGGIALGIDLNSTRRDFTRVSMGCELAPVKVGRAERSLAHFAICDVPPVGEGLPNPDGDVVAIVSATTDNSIQVTLQTPFDMYIAFTTAHVIETDAPAPNVNPYNFRLQQTASNSSGTALARYAIGKMQEWCHENNDGPTPEAVSIPPSHDPQVTNLYAYGAFTANCPREASDGHDAWFRALTRDLLDKITFVNSREFLVVREELLNSANTFVTADGEVFLRRRNTYADLLILLLFSVGMVLVRIFVRALTRNDLPRAIGLIVREDLDTPCCDSMLPRKDLIVRYARRAQHSVKDWG